MVLDHLIAKARDHFGCTTPEDWCDVRPEWVRGVHGCGPATLDHLRIYLAARGLTLKDDATPEFWQKNLQTAKIGGQISLVDEAVTETFTILIDSQEKQPWTFQGFRSGDKPLIVPIKWQSLGPSHGDYSIAGLDGRLHVERKSAKDALATFLCPPDTERGDRWRETMKFLASIECGAVVVEATIGQLLGLVQSHGKRTAETLRKQLHRWLLAWQHDLLLPFHFCDHRRLAEATALQVMRRYWKQTNQRNRVEKVDIDAVIGEL